MRPIPYHTFVLLALFAATLSNLHADGFIVIHDPPPGLRDHHPFAPLAVTQHNVETTIRGQIATTIVDQEFHNPNNRNLEGTYLFPVPKNSRIDKFQMDVGGKLMEAELLPAGEARKIYEDIVRRQKDPALLEFVDRDTFKLRIFPIEPHSKKRVKLTYTELLSYDSGAVSYRYPLSTERFSSAPIENVSVEVAIETETDLGPVLCPTHDAQVKRDGARRATVRWEDRNSRPDTDFEVVFTPSRDKGGLATSVLTWRSDKDDPGYFLLLAAPPPSSADSPAAPKDVVLVADTSGSMAGEKIEQARRALTFCIQNLNDGDRFDLVRFSTEARPVFEKLVDATDANRKIALRAVDKIKPIGGTAISAALDAALKILDDRDRPSIVIFVTDGLPTVGQTDPQKLIALAAETGAGARIFSFGVGSNVNTHLLDGIAEKTRAFSQYVGAREDLELKLTSFFTRIKDPVMTSLELSAQGDIKFSSEYPRPLPDLFSGGQLAVAGRYIGHGKASVRIKGKTQGQSIEHTFEAEFPETSEQNEFVARLWATRRVAWLLDEVRANREDKEIVDEITQLARDFGIVTPYTAYLILEDEAQRNVPLAQRSFQGLDRNEPAREAAKAVFGAFKDKQDGPAAVAVASAQNAMKYAGSSGAGGGAIDLKRSNEELASGIAPAVATATSLSGFSASEISAATSSLASLSQTTKRAGGRTFVQNGSQWVDIRAQSLKQDKLRRVQFNSEEYFDLLAKHPETAPWLALGRKILLAHNDALIEIFE